jgi:hypothetical protein
MCVLCACVRVSCVSVVCLPSAQRAQRQCGRVPQPWPLAAPGPLSAVPAASGHDQMWWRLTFSFRVLGRANPRPPPERGRCHGHRLLTKRPRIDITSAVGRFRRGRKSLRALRLSGHPLGRGSADDAVLPGSERQAWLHPRAPPLPVCKIYKRYLIRSPP